MHASDSSSKTGSLLMVPLSGLTSSEKNCEKKAAAPAVAQQSVRKSKPLHILRSERLSCPTLVAEPADHLAEAKWPTAHILMTLNSPILLIAVYFFGSKLNWTQPLRIELYRHIQSIY